MNLVSQNPKTNVVQQSVQQVYKITGLFPHLRFTKVNNMRKNKEHIIVVKHGETV